MRSVILAALVVVFTVSGVSTQNLIRLCGVDFQRALIHQCGASRWRRGFGSALLGDTKSSFVANSDSSEKLTLSDEGNLSNKPSLLEALQSPSRIRRNELNKIADICCKTGCNKQHLNSIC
ncbi:insulin-like 5a [Stegostoma tigrinum]|uniref:insulin-like 5a n=1 Tax=Stegostoma tigrinum TaxID=3053191 RepID=UPI00202B400D|nr:insulin-like 5a [Stegostoma tigrinum]